jgi:2-aminoethylphosphonate-pyruvate transaminase
MQKGFRSVTDVLVRVPGKASALAGSGPGAVEVRRSLSSASMASVPDPPPARDKLLFTPGPLTTSAGVKQAMLRDLGARDPAFLALVADVRARLLGLYGLAQADGWEAVLLPGSGMFAVEAALSCMLPRSGGKLLALVNGAHGERLARIAAVHDLACEVLRAPEDRPHDPGAVRTALARDPALTHVALVHVETTSGVLNPQAEIGAVARAAGRTFFVDATSAFGALPVDFGTVDLLAASADKCLEGVPGLAFVLARRSALAELEGRARTLALDLFAQWRGLETDGQFRFTPPTQVVLALRQALLELELEGGVAPRGARYRANHVRLRAGMEALGFRAYVPAAHSAGIIATFLQPGHPRFDFADFYRRLSERGFLLDPGKLTQVDGFRVANIGRLFRADVDALLLAVAAVLDEMGVTHR